MVVKPISYKPRIHLADSVLPGFAWLGTHFGTTVGNEISALLLSNTRHRAEFSTWRGQVPVSVENGK